MKMMKVGLIGVGGRGHNGWQMHKPEEGWEIIAGADPKASAREEFQKKFPQASVFDNYVDLLKIKEIDAVMIASPDYCHEEQAVAEL